MSFITWKEVIPPVDTLTGDQSPSRFEAVRNGLVLVSTSAPPGSQRIWRAYLGGISPIPSLYGHDAFHSERGRFANVEDAKASVEDYLGRWLLSMDMTYMNPVELD